MTKSTRAPTSAKTETEPKTDPVKDAPKTRREAPKERIPFGGRRKRLHFDPALKDPGYKYYWFKDQGDNLYAARAAGWMTVSFDEVGRIPDREGHGNNPCRAHGGVGEAGRPYDMVLMKKPIDLYNEDKAAVDQLANEVDQAMFREEFEGGKYGHHSVQVKNEE